MHAAADENIRFASATFMFSLNKKSFIFKKEGFKRMWLTKKYEKKLIFLQNFLNE